MVFFLFEYDRVQTILLLNHYFIKHLTYFVQYWDVFVWTGIEFNIFRQVQVRPLQFKI